MNRSDPFPWPPRRPWPEPPAALLPGDLWVFGYGSLMWRPGFPVLESHRARIHGFHRDLCVWSWVHRGSEGSPGLVMGLDCGGSCLGVAYRVEAGLRDAVYAYLHRREMVTAVYRPGVLPARLDDRRQVAALTFLVDRAHPQYAGRLDVAAAAAVVATARGQSGVNVDYVNSTVERLHALGIPPGRLGRVRDLATVAAV